MSYENEKIAYSKEHIYIVEIDLDYCSLTYGVGGCTVDPVLTGDSKCFNTANSHQSVDGNNDNYDGLTNFKTYRFCESRSPHPIGLDAIPSLMGTPNISPAKIDLSGGLGTRASVSLTFNDHPSSDIGIDKYVDDRSYIAFERGTYWTKLRARNPNYENRPLRVLSGYLVDGVFDAVNFTTRYYIIDKMNVSNGRATITAKDPLKLAANKKAQAPAPSTGQLLADITAGATSLTLIPVGIGTGTGEYPLSGKILINSEVIAFTRVANSDTLTLTGGRASNNTLAAAHSANDTVQLCLEYTDRKVSYIAFKLLNEFANIEIDLFDLDAWSAEVDAFLPGLLSGIIVKPFDVFKLLIELAEAMPHYLWWDERLNTIQLTALKAPPISSDVIDMEGNILADKFKTTDKPELRISTVFVNFGQFDPTKKLDEDSNYQQTYARIDTGSIAKYGAGEVKTINSRWITNTNAFAAQNAATLIGRRFSDTPREVSFSLEDKDSSLWVGQVTSVNHRDITDFTGIPVDTIFQIMTAKESKDFNYTALEYAYGKSLDGDPAEGELRIPLSGTLKNINLLDIYVSAVGSSPIGTTKVLFYIENGAVIGSTDTITYSLDTGTWPVGAEITLQLSSGSFIAGKGGDGAFVTVITLPGEPGGPAIILNHDLTLVNSGVIGGGGGGGNRAGGGGAGSDVGLKGTILTVPFIDSENGTLESGGIGGTFTEGGTVSGVGGDLGEDGGASVPPAFDEPAVAIAGVAINKNGFILTGALNDVRGDVVV